MIQTNPFPALAQIAVSQGVDVDAVRQACFVQSVAIRDGRIAAADLDVVVTEIWHVRMATGRFG